jgi:glycosyltransferase involved in cell wall biosynthesis
LTIHFFTKGPRREATARYRGFLMAEELARHGTPTRVEVVPRTEGFSFADRLREFGRALRALLAVRRGDVLYLVRTIYRRDFLLLVLLARFLRRFRLVFDFDDARYLEFPRPMRLLTRRADAVAVGSHALREWASHHNPHVHLLPTSVPFAEYARHARGDVGPVARPVLGWVGAGRNHVENLRLLVPVFRELRRLGHDFSFELLGAEGRPAVHAVFAPLREEGMALQVVDELPWDDVPSVAARLARFDVGLMPLLDDESARGKCAFKAIEYMACGVATVCSRVGENSYLIEDGVNGFLARDTAEWVEKIGALLADSGLRARLARAGQETVREGYSLEVNAPRLLALARGRHEGAPPETRRGGPGA